MNHELLLFCVLFGGFLGWGLWEDRPTQLDKRLRELADCYPHRAYLMDSFQKQFIRPKASQFPELDWGLLKAMEERRKLVNCWAEAIIDNQVINVGFDIPKNVQDKIINGFPKM